MSKIYIAEVALDVKTGGNNAIFTYLGSPNVKIGEAFLVPLGTRTELGYVLETKEIQKENLGFPIEKLKPLGEQIKGFELPAPLIETFKFIAKEYLCSIPEALSLAIPPGIQKNIVTTWTLSDSSLSPTSFNQLSTIQQETIQVLKDLGGELVESKLSPLPTPFRRSFHGLIEQGWVRKTFQLELPKEKNQLNGSFCLTSNLELIENFFSKESKRKPAQAALILHLQGTSETSFSAKELKTICKATDQTIRALERSKLLEKGEHSKNFFQSAPVLNPDQKTALSAIQKAIQLNLFESFLLFGVTGSGKTEVYMAAALDTMKKGKKVLYLVPEIALTVQVIAQLRSRFGNNIAVFHSHLSPKERLERWKEVKDGKIPIVLGPRSALFCPLEDIGLIIMDEEHEASYKQEVTPRYHAKKVARFMAKKHQAVLILGSATPSVESFHDAQKEKIYLLQLPNRVAQACLPTVHIEDLTKVYQKNSPTIFSDLLLEKMEQTLERKEQIILFLNRRAYAPFLMCRDCGHSFECHQCAVSLSYHRKEKILRCHHCGYQDKPPHECIKCSSIRLAPMGVGVEKVEEAVLNQFPGIKVARLDRDVAQKKGAIETILSNFRSGETQILVGTQMIAKGLDFPNVTLVGVIAADISLNLPDFRASERTFQLLSQVAGRAGRGSRPGEVVIQTFNPTHPAVLDAQNHDYLHFYELIHAERLKADYPPFKRLINVLFYGQDQKKVTTFSEEVRSLILEAAKEVEVLGPANCPLEKIQTQWRRHLLIKFFGDDSLKKIHLAFSKLTSKDVEWVVDVDPYTLM